MNSLAKTLACGSGLLALMIAASMSGCSSSDSNGASGGGAGTSSGGSAGTGTAGSSAAGTKNGAAGESEGGTGGSLGAAGSDNTGVAGADTTGTAGDTGVAGAGAEGTAVFKFCNQVAFGNAQTQTDTTMRLEIGTAPNVVSLSALTGTCAPMTGVCTSIPAGVALPVKLFDTSANTTVLDQAILTPTDGGEYVFYADVPTDAPTIEGGSITAGGPACSDFTYADLPQ